MTPPFTAEALVTLLRQYYPAGLWTDEPAYKASEEARRLTRVLEEAQKDMGAWKSFIQRVREAFPGCALWDSTLLFLDPCYRLRLSLPEAAGGENRRDEVVCLLSVLAPVYVLYASHALDTGPFSEAWTRHPPLPPEFQPYEARLAALTESTFGATRLPDEVLFIPVPDMAPRGGTVALGQARLVDLLFTPDRW